MRRNAAVVAALRQESPKLRSSVSGSVKRRIERSTSGELLTLRKGSTVMTPEPTPSYVSMLARYVDDDPSVSAGVEDVVSDGVVDGVELFVSKCSEDPDFVRLLADAAWADDEFVQQVLYDVADRLGLPPSELEEALRLSAQSGDVVVRGSVGGALKADLVPAGVTAALGFMLTKALATPAVKSAIAHAAHSTAGAAAAKKGGIVVAKKVGLGAMVKGVLLKFGVTIGASAIALIVVVPLLAAFMAWEWSHFPKSLAGKAGPEVAKALAEDSDELLEELASELVSQCKIQMHNSAIEKADEVKRSLPNASNPQKLAAFIRGLQGN